MCPLSSSTTSSSAPAPRAACWPIACGSITLVADGNGEENGRKVMVREILTRDGPVLRLTRMSRTVGQPFIMRHSYQLRPAA